VASAGCYAEQVGIKGHWDEELHGLDYLVYAYLQKGNNDAAREQCEYLKTIHEVYPVNFKVAYAFAAIPARYALENKSWNEASKLPVAPAEFPWQNFPWQESIIHFARLLGFVHTDRLDSAKRSLAILNKLHGALIGKTNAYEANRVAIQIKSGEAWIAWKEDKKDVALSLMEEAADMEDKSEKHPVTPAEVLRARELLGDMFMLSDQPVKALETYEAVIKKHPNTLNALYGAGFAAEKAGDLLKANTYYQQLLDVVGTTTHTQRKEVANARKFRGKVNSQ
jgi:tetratricopeptide (TPR) repeat protein